MPQGLKPRFVVVCNVWAKAQTYLPRFVVARGREKQVRFVVERFERCR